LVWRNFERGNLEDPEALEAEVWARVWRAYPRMRWREERLQARGLPGHSWRQWVSRTARRLVLDEQRRREAWRHNVGMRAFRERDTADAAAATDASEWNAPLDVDTCVPLDAWDGPRAAGDPAVLAERAWLAETLARGLAELPRLEAMVVRCRAEGMALRAVARKLGVNLYVVRRAEEEALRRLRRALGAPPR
jgi:RNA polymerase sigma factor (sigma-70 family)